MVDNVGFRFSTQPTPTPTPVFVFSLNPSVLTDTGLLGDVSL
ncbi:MAG: hypothetical protein V7L14_06175 [Nostoc sp.]